MTTIEYSRSKGERKSFLLRMDERLWAELSEWAAQEFRSVNGQIELILSRAVDERRKGEKRAEGRTTLRNGGERASVG